MPPVGVPREHRDLRRLYDLWEIITVFNQAQRQLDEDGVIMACCKDYHLVRELTADIFSVEQQRSVNPKVREVVNTVKGMGDMKLKMPDFVKGKFSDESFAPTEVASAMKADLANTGRYLQRATRAGYLENTSRIDNRPRYKLTGNMPDDNSWLPPVAAVEAVCCKVVMDSGGMDADAPATPESGNMFDSNSQRNIDH